jgi:NAD(P)-dependent dehydrogenase (short-subunit alcohol dehydrogenase family)
VVLGARRVERIEALARELTGKGRKALALRTDVTDAAQVKKLVDAAVEAYGRIDVILNNAGLMPHSMLAMGKVEDWNRMIDVNIRGVLYGIAAAMPPMQKRGHGRPACVGEVLSFAFSVCRTHSSCRVGRNRISLMSRDRHQVRLPGRRLRQGPPGRACRSMRAEHDNA